MKERNLQLTLTPREGEILALVANGYSAKEVASVLGIAPRTVERHTENVRLKVRARNRPHMVMQAVRAGILSIEPLQLAEPAAELLLPLVQASDPKPTMFFQITGNPVLD